MLLALEALLVVKVLLVIWVLRELRSAPASGPADGVHEDVEGGESRAMSAGSGPPEFGRVPPDS